MAADTGSMTLEWLEHFRLGLTQVRRSYLLEELYNAELDSPLSLLSGDRPLTRLHHYTTAEGLKGIVESNSLWATAAYYLNDSSEVEYGCAVLRAVLSDWVKANEQNLADSAIAVRELDRLISHPLSQANRMTTMYVACFCERDNLLSQWRAYGQKGGYSIGFPLRRREHLGLYPQNPFYSAELLKVNYEKHLQRRALNDLLKRIMPMFDNPLIAAGLKADKLADPSYAKFAEHLVYLLELVYEVLLEVIVTFKNKAFEEEREWRIVVMPRSLSARPIDSDSAQNVPTVQFRPLRGVLTPYFSLTATSGQKLPIESVRFGPTLAKAQAENSLNTFLGVNKYTGVDIRGSDIPVLL